MVRAASSLLGRIRRAQGLVLAVARQDHREAKARGRRRPASRSAARGLSTAGAYRCCGSSETASARTKSTPSGHSADAGDGRRCPLMYSPANHGARPSPVSPCPGHQAIAASTDMEYGPLRSIAGRPAGGVCIGGLAPIAESTRRRASALLVTGLPHHVHATQPYPYRVGIAIQGGRPVACAD
jgi:hypothetical protein